MSDSEEEYKRFYYFMQNNDRYVLSLDEHLSNVDLIYHFNTRSFIRIHEATGLKCGQQFSLKSIEDYADLYQGHDLIDEIFLVPDFHYLDGARFFKQKIWFAVIDGRPARIGPNYINMETGAFETDIVLSGVASS